LTSTVHLLPGATVAPEQLSGPLTKSAASVPPMVAVTIDRSALPLLLSVIVRAALLVATSWSPKLRLVGVSVTRGRRSWR
jgi:hypothetical protein